MRPLANPSCSLVNLNVTYSVHLVQRTSSTCASGALPRARGQKDVEIL